VRDRPVQLLSAAAAVACIAGAGSLLPRILDASDRAQLRYTDVSVEGAPPIVAVGAAVGALRGLVVDYLWIRLQQMRELGQYYDARRLADLITKLQPRFGEVWAFHGHNLAYNLSVATSTPGERWRLDTRTQFSQKLRERWPSERVVAHDIGRVTVIVWK
jgi:hypothetical protein